MKDNRRHIRVVLSLKAQMDPMAWPALCTRLQEMLAKEYPSVVELVNANFEVGAYVKTRGNQD